VFILYNYISLPQEGVIYLNIIIQHTATNNSTTPAYEGRITFFPSTASLELRDLTLEDGGDYSVNVFGSGVGRIKLDVYGKQPF
uniref:Immunoglobulin V-set domain-containing protein n=1 Tax=Oryzias melastigma TaxID=30732 RepID=A0A3B3E0S4_ORYME